MFVSTHRCQASILVLGNFGFTLLCDTGSLIHVALAIYTYCCRATTMSSGKRLVHDWMIRVLDPGDYCPRLSSSKQLMLGLFNHDHSLSFNLNQVV